MKVFKNRCYNGGQKHKFKAIYTEKKNSDVTEIGGTSSFVHAALYYKEYVKTQCEWCGAVKED